MNELAKADAFFFITSIAVVVLTILLAIAMYYLVRILRNVDAAMARIREEGMHIADGIHELHGKVEASGSRFMDLLRFMGGVYSSTKRKKTSPKRGAAEKESPKHEHGSRS